jgi:hypothetical protein
MTSRARLLLLGSLAFATCVPSMARADFWGDAAKIVRDKSSAIHVTVPKFQIPHNQGGARITDPDTYTYFINKKTGAVSVSTIGGPPQLNGQVATIQYRDDGSGYWVYYHDGTRDIQDTPYVFDKNKAKAHFDAEAARKKHEQDVQDHAKAQQAIMKLQQKLLTTPEGAFTSWVGGLDNQKLFESKAYCASLIAKVKHEQLGDTEGFERVQFEIQREINRRLALAANPGNSVFDPGQPQAPSVGPPPASPAPPPASPGFFAKNLGITYRKVAYDDGSFGAELIKDPDADTPAAGLGLERGDIVIEMDGQRFFKTGDVLTHTEETDIVFIDVRTKETRSAKITLP